VALPVFVSVTDVYQQICGLDRLVGVVQGDFLNMLSGFGDKILGCFHGKRSLRSMCCQIKP
tara:strand:+ start:1541 stop:1723 length:183 start_codon:yes stop_codon:yes gene_type:complete